MPLTDTAIRNAKPEGRSVKLSDGGGLFLLVRPSGARLWRLAYRFGGKQKQLAIGSYPVIGLAAARKVREDAKRLLASGVDPAHQKKLDKIAARVAAADTFGAIADEYLAKLKREGLRETTLVKNGWLIDFARPDFGKRPIAQITAPEVLEVLRGVERRGRLETARRLRGTIGAVFRYAIATARATNDPTFALRGALATPPVQHRAAITDPKEFGGLLRAIDGFTGQPTTKAALQLMALLFPRPGELRAAEWSEFKLDAAMPVWDIPASRTKMRRPHRIPLPRQAVDILKELHLLTGGGRLVFPAFHTVRQPISENTLNGALRRLGYSSEEMTAHGFRAAASTILNESGQWSPDAIERALAHVDPDDVRRAYARGAHWQERVEMAAWWADLLDALRQAGQVATIALPPRRIEAPRFDGADQPQQTTSRP